MQDNSDLIIRDCCEAEVAEFGQPDTICITVEVLREIVQRHSPGPCLHQIQEPEADIWPCVNIDVDASGKITNAKLYSPGLPAGNHDVYPVRVPYMDEHTEAWRACVDELEKAVPGFMSLGNMNGIECAVSAIRGLSERAKHQELAAAEQAAWHAGLDEGRVQAAPAAVAVPDDMNGLRMLGKELGTISWMSAFEGDAWDKAIEAVQKRIEILLANAPEVPATSSDRTTGYVAPKGRYVPPVLFSPYTGEPRDARDIASDPRGVLIVPPGAALAATPAAAQVARSELDAWRDGARFALEAVSKVDSICWLTDSMKEFCIKQAAEAVIAERDRLRALLATATGLPAQAAEVLGWVHKRNGKIGNHFYTYEPHCDTSVRDDGGEKIAVIAASSTAPQAQADARDAELLSFLQDQCIDLRCFTTSDGEDVGWRTVQHHMSEPRERVVSEVCSDDPRRAIREAMARIKRDPYCTGPLHLEDDAAIAAAKGE